MGVEDVNLRERGGVGKVEVSAADGLRGGEVEVRNLVDEETQLAGLGGEEGVERVCVVFGGVEGGADATVCVLVSELCFRRDCV